MIFTLSISGTKMVVIYPWICSCNRRKDNPKPHKSPPSEEGWASVNKMMVETSAKVLWGSNKKRNVSKQCVQMVRAVVIEFLKSAFVRGERVPAWYD
jgi:hypothetical protein